MQADEFGPAANRHRAQDSHGTHAHSAGRPVPATAIARYQYTLSAVLVAFVVTAVGLFLLTDSRISDLEARLGAQIALAATAPAPVDNGNQLAFINEVNDRLDGLQAALDELQTQSGAGREPDAPVINADSGGPLSKTEAKTAALAEPQETDVAATKQITAPVQPVKDTWLINIASFSQRASAQLLQGKLEALGRNATTEPVNLNGKALYRVRVTGLPDRKAAEEEALRLQKTLQLSGFWVAKDPGGRDAQ
ncbi:SPOR domain-containing protein [Marinobacterium rhizophilum]|uniref:SPOR domain-containing protein n=1 Tax=Marinobacterium rhizophilum TaxID=420402 RepID=A0ABY5HKV0_9GAMM|nr:SPOR domain-containing protein [Marinobacterium rhizophilum]UTW11884.1 SPOR domain-containing protein [Marinobacterium rhizophilum]